MPNLLVQIGNTPDDDNTYQVLNHANYTHKTCVTGDIRIDFFNYENETQSNTLETDDYFIGVLGYVLFAGNENEPLQYILSLIQNGESVTDAIESGVFVIIFVNKSTGLLTLINDRFGLYPLFSYKSDDAVIVSTEPKGIIRSSLSTSLNFDLTALKEYTHHGYSLGLRTFVREIIKSRPASQIVISNLEITETRYFREKWEFNKDSVSKKDLVKLQESFWEGLASFHRSYPRKTMLSLSAGYDSRYIYYQNNFTDDALTFDRKSDQFPVVEKIIKGKPAKLHIVETAYNDKTIDEIEYLFALGDGQLELANTHLVRTSECLTKNGFEAHLDGFAGDAILGGSYLKFRPEMRAEFGKEPGNSINDFRDEANFNTKLLEHSFRERLDKIEIDYEGYLAEFTNGCRFDVSDKTVIGDQNSLDEARFCSLSPRKTYFLLKWHSRGVNWLAPASIFHMKHYINVFPYFHYSFFDQYSKISFDLLRLRKLHTRLFKLLPKRLQRPGDSVHKLSYRWPVKVRILVSILVQFLEKVGIYNPAKITPYKDQFLENKALQDYVFEKIECSPFADKEWLRRIKSDKRLMAENHRELFRLLNLSLFADAFGDKVKMNK